MRLSLSARILSVLSVLRKRYPAKGMVDLGNPEDTLLATLLTARTTDAQVLRIFPAFRKRFPTLRALANAREQEIEQTILTIGLYHSKAVALKQLASRVLETYHGTVPSSMEELVTLAGVGRKTASCVLWYGFRIPAIAVDTHVFRIARRLGWARGNTPTRVEEELRACVPRRRWGEVNRTFVPFGREICIARIPRCWKCPVARWCLYSSKTPPPISQKRR